jgi:hypothetical protein
MPWSLSFIDMQRLAQPRHMAYARAHKFDLWSIYGDIHPEYKPGAWSKIWLIIDALKAKYEYVVWIDSDAAIMDFEADLRNALPADKYIGAVLHTPDKSAYLKLHQVPPHMNVGVMYIRNSSRVRMFFDEWLAAWPTDIRFIEQAVFNELTASPKYRDLVHCVDDAYNATVNVNMVKKPIVKGYHGVMPPEKRLDLMKIDLADDFMKFRV